MASRSGGSGLSLKMRAIALLAQRDQSIVEMRRKLLRIARQQAGDRAEGPAGDEAAEDDEAHGQAASEQVEQLLGWLQAEGFLDEQRFIESRIQARAQRWGNARIRQELAQHGLSPDDSSMAALRDSEVQRAAEVRRRKFGAQLPVEAADRARQMRFLATRGFSSDAIRRVLRADED